MKEGMWILCSSCSGHGQVSWYSQDDFLGPEECYECDGKGVIWLYPNGALAKFKGGPLLGRIYRRTDGISKAKSIRNRS